MSAYAARNYQLWQGSGGDWGIAPLSALGIMHRRRRRAPTNARPRCLSLANVTLALMSTPRAADPAAQSARYLASHSERQPSPSRSSWRRVMTQTDLRTLRSRMTPRKKRAFLHGAVAFLSCVAQMACSLQDGPGEGAAEEAAERTPATNAASLRAARVYRPPALPSGSYPAPTTNVLHVAKSGRDSNTGLADSPFLTVGRAITVANQKDPSLGRFTIVIHAGIYREGGLRITRDKVTLQRNLTDRVSLWGSHSVSAEFGSGGIPANEAIIGDELAAPIEQACAQAALLYDGSGNLRYDPAQAFGAEYPLAVSRAGVPLRRVATGTRPGPGQYAYDPATNRLTVGDPPSEIEMTYERIAIETSASDVIIAGLDIRGYATCTVDWRLSAGGRTYYNAAVQIYKNPPAAASRSQLRDCTVANNAAGAVSVVKAQAVWLVNDTIVNNGWTGAHAGEANGLVVMDSRISYNNVRHWNTHADAGMKTTFIMDGVVYNNVFEQNAAAGYWCDQHCGRTGTNWFTISRNVARDNDAAGIFYEISRHAVIASNLAHDNGGPGIASYGSRNVQIWNNTAVDNNRQEASYTANVSIADDRRCVAGDTLPGGSLCRAEAGVDPLAPGRYCESSSTGSEANTCNAENVVLKNNIISGSASTRPLLSVKDTGGTRYGANRIMSGSDYQAYYRPSGTQPRTLIEWQGGGGGDTYTNLLSFRFNSGSGRESHSYDDIGARNTYFVDYAGRNFAQNQANANVWNKGEALPPEVLRAAFWPFPPAEQPTPRIGAFAWAPAP
jgi:parallel beta-helix repeat protein